MILDTTTSIIAAVDLDLSQGIGEDFHFARWNTYVLNVLNVIQLIHIQHNVFLIILVIYSVYLMPIKIYMFSKIPIITQFTPKYLDYVFVCFFIGKFRIC